MTFDYNRVVKLQKEWKEKLPYQKAEDFIYMSNIVFEGAFRNNHQTTGIYLYLQDVISYDYHSSHEDVRKVFYEFLDQFGYKYEMHPLSNFYDFVIFL